MAELPDRQSLPALIGQSPAFAAMLEHVSALAPLERPALVIGERGTGKELVSARLHFLSRRWARPYVKLNCASLSEELLDSELFGHEAGAFTGAVRRHIGRFERADGGTLFLDEIAAASARVQEKLLRAIEYGELERVGGSATLTVDVRVVAAANVDLPALAAAGRFRADLLDRLAFDVVTLPPLRARPEDIPLLTDHFAAAMAHDLDREAAPDVTPAARARLASHGWPGNVRELRNVVERAVYRAAPGAGPIDDIRIDPFESAHRIGTAPPVPAAPPPPVPDAPFVAQVRDFEMSLLRRALREAGGRQRTAATRLGLTYDQFRGLLRKYALAEGRRSPSPTRSAGEGEKLKPRRG